MPGEIINIGGAEYRSVDDLAELCCVETGADHSLLRFEQKDGHNVVNKRPDIAKARKILGHDPKVTLEVGVRLTVEWMRRFYGIPECVQR
jgi:dTDP-glucose 4,6-dehydratase